MDWKSGDFIKGFVLGCIAILVLVFITSMFRPKYQIAAGKVPYVINMKTGRVWLRTDLPEKWQDLGKVTENVDD